MGKKEKKEGMDPKTMKTFQGERKEQEINDSMTT